MSPAMLPVPVIASICCRQLVCRPCVPPPQLVATRLHEYLVWSCFLRWSLDLPVLLWVSAPTCRSLCVRPGSMTRFPACLPPMPATGATYCHPPACVLGLALILALALGPCPALFARPSLSGLVPWSGCLFEFLCASIPLLDRLWWCGPLALRGVRLLRTRGVLASGSPPVGALPLARAVRRTINGGARPPRRPRRMAALAAAARSRLPWRLGARCSCRRGGPCWRCPLGSGRQRGAPAAAPAGRWRGGAALVAASLLCRDAAVCKSIDGQFLFVLVSCSQ